jgi:hypothetical protein
MLREPGPCPAGAARKPIDEALGIVESTVKGHVNHF